MSTEPGEPQFADLFSVRGRASVPPSVVATVMVLQRLEGLSDREAVERYSFDARWRYACGAGGGYGWGGWESFSHTVLVDMRARLAASADPGRLFRVVLDAADVGLQARLRAVLAGGEDYVSAGKPVIDWDDAEAREALVDAPARDGFACLAVLDGLDLQEAVAAAGRLLATVLGQDLEQADDGVFRIARKVARDRVISTVDPQARHGHKTSARGFDGYKGHIAIDPDSELVTATVVTPGNAGDAAAAPRAGRRPRRQGREQRAGWAGPRPGAGRGRV